MKLFFIGIKGTGMASLALMCLDLGHDVSGSDIDKHFFTEDKLRDRSIPIYNFGEHEIEEGSTVIVGNAFKDDFADVEKAYQNSKLRVVRYHQFLGELMQNYKTITVSGSHGKTTTTTMLKEMMSTSKKTGYLIGDGHGDLHEDDEYLAVEACEYRRHFLAYYPDIAIITNVEIDHVDYFKDVEDYEHAYIEFAENVKDFLMICGDDEAAYNLKIDKKHFYYGFADHNDFIAKVISFNETHSIFDVYYQDKKIGHYDLPIVGDHMILNAVGVISVGYLIGLDNASMNEGLNQFNGATRRFVIDDQGANIFVDDYAHHPTEIKVTMLAAKRRYPNRKIVAIFKPHRVSRVQYFADEFASALLLADQVCLCPFTSIDDQEEGIDLDITYLQNRIPGSIIVDDNNEDARILADMGPAVYVFMSSKDIYPLKEKVKRYQQS